MSDGRARAAAGAALVVLILIVLSDTLLGGRIFSTADTIFSYAPFSAHRPPGWPGPSNFLLTDPLEGWIPNLTQARMDLSHGVLPLWNPDEGAGHPLFGSQVDALLFPITWLAFVLPFLHSFAWSAALRLALAALGTYLFARDLRLGRAPSLLAAFGFAFGTYFVSWLQHPQTLVWLCLPWMMLATRRICTSGGLGMTALLALAMGLAWLGGHPESAAFLLAVAAIWAVVELGHEWRHGTRSDPRGSAPAWAQSVPARAGLVAAGLVLGVALGAVALLPLKELLDLAGSTHRGSPPLSLKAVVSFVFPGYWGMPNKAAGQTSLGPVNYIERTAYIGALPTLLAVVSLGRRRPREVWLLLGLAALSFVLTFNIPWVGDEIRRLPGGNVARLTRFLVILSFSWSMLAAYGLERWLSADARARRRMLAVMAVASVLPPLIFVAVRHGILAHHLTTALGQLPIQHYHETDLLAVQIASAWRWVLICAIGIAAMALSARLRWPTWVTVVIVIALTGIDLGTLDRNFHGALPRSWASPPAPAALRFLKTHQGDQRIAATDFGIPANISTTYGLRDTRIGLDIPYPQRFSQLWTGLGGINGDEDFILGASPLAHRLADIFATRYVFVPTGGKMPRWLHVVQRGPGGVVGLNRTALPRAWVAYGWRSSGGRTQDLDQTLHSTTRMLERQPVIEGARTAQGPGGTPTVARVTDNSTDTVTVHATARRAGYLILDDSAYPGWKVTVDGHSTDWLPANENFRAVAIPAGTHTVVFRYRPSSVYDGAVVSAVALAGIIALAVAGAILARRRRAGVADAGRQGPAQARG